MLLVRKRNTQAFMQAGGKIEPGETAFEALGRELEEELDFTPRQADAVFLGIFSAEAANEPGRRVEASLYRIRSSGEFTAAAELEEAVWVTVAEAEKLPLAPLTRDYVLPLARGLFN